MRVSFSFTTTLRPLVVYSGLVFMGGETRMLFSASLMLTYSSNAMLNCFSLKFREPFAGVVESTTGGFSSLGPPEG